MLAMLCSRSGHRCGVAMDLEELRAFLAVADSGSFLTAAKSLRLSRATLRRRIDQLEARAGVMLVDRTRTGVLLTEAGTMLAGRGRLMVQEASALIESVREVGAEPAGVLRILLPVGLPPHLLTPLLGFVRARYPRISYRVHFSDDPVGGIIENVNLRFTSETGVRADHGYPERWSGCGSGRLRVESIWRSTALRAR